jgi:hypothetical protein
MLGRSLNWDRYSVLVADRPSTAALSFVASVEGGDTAPAAGDAAGGAVVVLTLSASLPRLGADPLAGASVSPCSGASAPSSSAPGVVVVAVSVCGGPDVDEPLGALGPSPAGAPAAASRNGAGTMVWSEIVAAIWSGLFVISVALMTRGAEHPSRLARTALLFAVGSVLALFGVVLKGAL